MILYARIGDADDYHDYDSLQELAEAIGGTPGFVSGPIEYANDLGVQCEGFRGNNYISAYYGTDVENAVRGLDNAEVEIVNSYLPTFLAYLPNA